MIEAVSTEREARARPRTRTVRVALAGCGAVGGALLRLLEAQAEEIAAAYGVRFDVVRVLVRRPELPRAGRLPRERFTADAAEFLAADADLVVEAVGGLEPALRIARAALSAGRPLVTANKALLAAHGPALCRLAHERGTRLDFESAVGGGIPVVRALRDSLGPSGVSAVRGILNGTSNYLLTRLGEGAGWAQALAEAREKGFAEADPARDVDGRDAEDKIRILAWLAFGVEPAALAPRRRGLLPGAERLAADAAAAGGVVRLVAEALRLPVGAGGGAGVAAAVEPVVVAPGSELGATRYEQNAVLVATRWNGTLRLAGPGAGGEPTAAVLLADMLGGARPLLPTPGAAAIPDPRSHRWLLSVDATHAAALPRALESAAVEAEPVGSTARVLTAGLGAARADALVRALEAQGASPVLARWEGAA